MAKILVVDDSGLSRKMLRGILERAGHDVVESSDGVAALERYSLERPDLVMLDLVMDGLTGFEVLDRLHELDAEVKVVVATADIQASSREITKASGARGLVTKPFEAEQVLSTVDEALRAPMPAHT
jgi:two-component system, chemotaxis family, chemotaxis protein CheY